MVWLTKSGTPRITGPAQPTMCAIDTAGGSTAVTVRLSLDHHRVPLPQMSHLEVTAVMLNTLGGVLVVSSYKPLNKELLHRDLAVVFDAHRRVIMAGDLNCKHRDWNSR